MDPSLQAAPGYYVWELPGSPLVIHLKLHLIDRLSAEIMRGFGAIPKRGAEVGGLLLGSVEQGAPTIVRVDDFEVIPCDYKRGPSYLFTAADGAAFDQARSAATSAVGYFRSHTRDGMALGIEDVELMEHNFPAPAHIALLVKPFATKVSVASFFFREGGMFQSTAPLEFPFRRRELTGEEAPPRRSMLERVPRRRAPRNELPMEDLAPMVQEDHDPAAAPAGPAYAYASPVKSRARSGWVWIPLSFVFLVLGMVLGFQAALTLGPRLTKGTADYSLGLTVSKDGDNLSVRWNGEAPAVRAAQKGMLEIEDGSEPHKPVELDSAQLSNGSIQFRNRSDNVHFRLIVYPQAQVAVMQTVEWGKK